MGNPVVEFKNRFRKTFSLDFKDDISVYYCNLLVTYVLCALSCFLVCMSAGTQGEMVTGLGTQVATDRSLDILQTVADSLIPTTVAFACGVVLQNLSTIARVGATKFPWLLALMLGALVYWGGYSAYRQVTSHFKGIILIFASVVILFLCTMSTICCVELQQHSNKGTSLSA